jgi:hypothetical protein
MLSLLIWLKIHDKSHPNKSKCFVVVQYYYAELAIIGAVEATRIITALVCSNKDGKIKGTLITCLRLLKDANKRYKGE